MWYFAARLFMLLNQRFCYRKRKFIQLRMQNIWMFLYVLLPGTRRIFFLNRVKSRMLHIVFKVDIIFKDTKLPSGDVTVISFSCHGRNFKVC